MKEVTIDQNGDSIEEIHRRIKFVERELKRGNVSGDFQGAYESQCNIEEINSRRNANEIEFKIKSERVAREFQG